MAAQAIYALMRGMRHKPVTSCWSSGTDCRRIAAGSFKTTSKRSTGSWSWSACQRTRRNPVEYIWGYMKQRELANLCLHTIGEVGTFARNRLKSMQRRPQLITAFWQQAELSINVIYLRKVQ